MNIKKKESRDLFVVNFVQFVSSPQTHAKRYRKIKKTLEICPNNLTETQWMKMWRGFYYAIWYCEMRKGGEEMIEEIGLYPNASFLLSGFKALSEAWNGIDAFRIDKYMFLIRFMLRNVMKQQIGALLEDKILFNNNPIIESSKKMETTTNNSDENEQISDQIVKKNVQLKNAKLAQEKKIGSLITIKANIIDFILSISSSSVGLFLHICEIYLDELEKNLADITEEKIKIKMYFDMIIPYGKWLSLLQDSRLYNAICENIFDRFIDEFLVKESISIRRDILDAFINPLMDIASHSDYSKNRIQLYTLLDKFRKKISSLAVTKRDSVKLKRKIVGIDRKTKRVKYELVTSTPFVRSIVPLPVI